MIKNSTNANSIAGVYSFGREGIRVGGTLGEVEARGNSCKSSR